MISIPLAVHSVIAGFPSPADDHIEQHLSLDEHLISHPAATFMVKVSGDSMQDDGIFAGDMLVVDRSLTASPGDIVIAIVDNAFTVKQLQIKNKSCLLVPANPDYNPITLNENNGDYIWGVVSSVIRKLR